MERPKKILVIDDEPDVVEMITMALESADFAVISAYNGAVGLEKARDEKPDAIVLDIMMPEKDGFVTCKELKASSETEHIPILILTGIREHLSNSRYAKSMGLSLEAEDFLEKPVNPKEIIKRVSEMLE
ncbi:MAG: response regulator [Deltaproteobacteria bacterium]|nr:response regulator [Deltaproteobacteria bacterium]MBW2307553.1 response regulator [Deltaproteobacteria bacterium]